MPSSENGKLHCQKLGSPENEAVLFLHGFMGIGAEWRPIAEALQAEYYCLLPDLPGHGRSLNLREADYTLPGAARLVMDVLEEEGLKKVNLVGYSMGGRLGWYLAVHYPDRWEKVILENTTPGIPDEAGRAARRREDEKLARRLEKGELRHFVEAWYRLPLWRSLRGHPALPRLIRERCRNSPPELAKSLRKMGTGAQPDLRKSFERIECPVFLLTGMKDVKFYGIARELKKAFPEFHLREFPEAGHNIHFEMPEQYLECLKQILKNKGGEDEQCELG